MSVPTIIEHPSPSQGPRPAGSAVDMLILHYTGMRSCTAALQRLCDRRAQVSAHYLVDEDGSVYRLVSEEHRAWHAGQSCWDGERDINGFSIGIELVNPGHEFGYRPFPAAQIAALEALARKILGRHPIPPERVLGHSDVAPQRKQDPGELFPWERLARAGIGIWPDLAKTTGASNAAAPDVASVQRGLASFGYEVPTTGHLDGKTRLVVAAFQRHFRPARVDGRIDHETVARLGALLDVAQGQT